MPDVKFSGNVRHHAAALHGLRFAVDYRLHEQLNLGASYRLALVIYNQPVYAGVCLQREQKIFGG